MRFLKNIFSQLHSFALWFLASAFIWGYVFTLVTDTSPEKKVTIYCNVPAVEYTALAAALEKNMPDGLKMIKVHSFDYVMMDSTSFEQGDIFIVSASDIEEYSELLLPIGEERGIKVYDAETGAGAATAYIGYLNEDYYLFLGAGSPHLEDGKALEVALELLKTE